MTAPMRKHVGRKDPHCPNPPPLDEPPLGTVHQKTSLFAMRLASVSGHARTCLLLEQMRAACTCDRTIRTCSYGPPSVAWTSQCNVVGAGYGWHGHERRLRWSAVRATTPCRDYVALLLLGGVNATMRPAPKERSEYHYARLRTAPFHAVRYDHGTVRCGKKPTLLINAWVSGGKQEFCHGGGQKVVCQRRLCGWAGGATETTGNGMRR